MTTELHTLCKNNLHQANDYTFMELSYYNNKNSGEIANAS